MKKAVALVGAGPALPGASSVPGFLAKLWALVEDPGSDDVISWSRVRIAGRMCRGSGGSTFRGEGAVKAVVPLGAAPPAAGRFPEPATERLC